MACKVAGVLTSDGKVDGMLTFGGAVVCARMLVCGEEEGGGVSRAPWKVDGS